MKASRVQPLLDEANELARIMRSSRITAGSRPARKRRSARPKQKSQIKNPKSKTKND